MHLLSTAADAGTVGQQQVAGSAGSAAEPAGFCNPLAGTPKQETAPQPFEKIPGPGAVDVEAYNARNHQYIVELHEKYGDIVAVDMSSMARAANGAPTKRVLFVRKPEMAKAVLRHSAFAKTWDAAEVSADTVDYVHNLVQPLLAGTVFNKQGEGGAHHGRMALRPMFNAVKQLSAGFAEQIDEALKAWPVDGGIDALGSCHDLIRQALLFAIAGSAAPRANAATESVFHEVMDYFVERYSSSGHDACATAEDEATMAKAMDAGLRIVQAWREHGQSGTSEAEQKTMLAVMSEAGNSDEEMAAMVINAIIAGAEAPASTLAQFLQELAFNAPLQTALAAEIAAGAPAGTEVLDVLDKLTFVDDCVMEALRFFAPATLVQRVAVKPTQLGGYEVPPGTVVGICVTAVHRDATVHENPWTFDPLGRRGKLNLQVLKEEDCFMTFGGGPRGCPGKNLGKMMLRIALAKIVQRSEFYSNQRRGCDHLSQPAGGGGKGIPKFVEWQVGGIPLQIRPQPLRTDSAEQQQRRPRGQWSAFLPSRYTVAAAGAAALLGLSNAIQPLLLELESAAGLSEWAEAALGVHNVTN
jgi:cytochrome P450